MRNLISLVLIITSILVGSAFGSEPSPLPFDVVRDEPTPRPTGAGPVTLTYDIVLDTNHQCDEVTIRLHQTENMTLLSPEVTTYPMFGHGPTTVTLDVIIPEDTSGIEFFIEGCDLPRTFWWTFFVVEEDTVKVFPGRNPHQLWTERYWKEREEARIRNWSQPKDSTWIKSHLLVEPRHGYLSTDGVSHDSGSVDTDEDSLGERSSSFDGQTIHQSAEDRSADQGERETRRKAREEGLRLARDPEGNLLALPPEEQEDSLRVWEIREQTARMREMEKEPLTEQEHQSIIVGGDIYVRQRGQQEFRKLERVGSREEAARAIPDLAQEARGSVEHEYIIDLRDSNDLALVRQLSDSMSETDSTGFYRVRLSKDAFRELKARGFVDKWYRPKAWRQLRSGAEGEEVDSSSGDGIKQPADSDGSRLDVDDRSTLYFEGFEGFFPGDDWVVWNTGFNYCDWKQVSCEKDTVDDPSSVYSVWSTDCFSDCSFYNYGQMSWLDQVVGLDISDYHNVRIRIRALSDVYPGDGSAYYATDDTTEYMEFFYEDLASHGWQTMYFSDVVEDDWDSLFLSFLFWSGEESHDEDGCYLDNIRVLGDLKADLTYETPTGWYGPVVPSMTTGTHTLGDLYAGETTYFDVAIINEGGFTTDAFAVTLSVGGVWVMDTVLHNGLGAGVTAEFHDIPYVVPYSGDYEVELWIDPDWWIDELDENNNHYSHWFTWVGRQPNLTWTTPSGWDGPIVASSDSGSTTNGSLWEGQTSFFNWAIENVGRATALGPFEVFLLLEDTLVLDAATIDSLPQDSLYAGQNIAYAVPQAGWHSVRLVIDSTHAVDETDELDNEYTTDFEWLVPEIGAWAECYYIWRNDTAHTYHWQHPDSFLVRLMDADSGQAGDILAEGMTSNGEMEFPVNIYNVEEDGTPQDVFLRMYACNPSAWAGENLNVSGVPVLTDTVFVDSDTITDAPNGFLCFGTFFDCNWNDPDGPPVGADTTASKYFYPVGLIQDSHRKWCSHRPGDNLTYPAKVHVNDSIAGNHYSTNGDIIYLCSADTSGATGFRHAPFNDHTILHEYGHRVSYFMGGYWNYNPITPHLRTTIVSEIQALDEGFSDFWACWSEDAPTYVQVCNLWRDTAWWDIENGQYGRSGLTHPYVIWGTTNTLGWRNACSAAGTLWDVLDADAGLEDLSCMSDWGDTVWSQHQPDGIGDNLADGIDNIFTVLFDFNIQDASGADRQLQSMREFIQIWCDSAVGNSPQVWDIYYEHGDSAGPRPTRGECSCCLARGDIDNDGGGPDISDLVFVVTYMFSGGPQPPCLLAADVDGSGGAPDISDLVYLVTWMFSGGAPAVPCGWPPVMVADSISKGAMLTAE